jgi:hypothetical protein
MEYKKYKKDKQFNKITQYLYNCITNKVHDKFTI